MCAIASNPAQLNLRKATGYAGENLGQLHDGMRRRSDPLQQRIETAVDDADLKEVYNTERHLLYVACTRARDHLLITGVQPASEFLDDLR